MMKTSSESGSSSDAKGKQESEFATLSGESTIIVKAIAEDKSRSEIGQGVSLSGASSQVKPINTTVLDTVSKSQQGHAVFGNRNHPDLKFATARRTLSMAYEIINGERGDKFGEVMYKPASIAIILCI
jgi:hypothetical protein